MSTCLIGTKAGELTDAARPQIRAPAAEQDGVLVTEALRLLLGPVPVAGLAVLAPAGTAVLAARAAGRAANRRARFAWRCQVAGCLCWLLAPLTWLTLDHLPWISPADAGRVGFLLCAATGFWLTSRAPGRRARFRMLLDGVVGAAAMLVMVWAFVLSPAIDLQHVPPAELAFGLAYPLAALVLVVFYLFLAFLEMRPGRRRMPKLFVLGLLAIAVSDGSYVLHSAAAGQPARDAGPLGWMLGFALVGAAAASYRGTTPRQSLPPTTWWVTYAPYVALVPAGGTLVWQAVTGPGIPDLEWAVSGVAIAAVLLRQLLVLSENRILVARLVAGEEKLRHQATHDSLTGLANRALLLETLTGMLAERRQHPAPLSVMFIDLDDFKEINDTYGHQVGDEVLAEVAARLRAVVHQDGLAVRLGGDEYAAVLPCDAAAADAAADRLRQAFQEPCHAGGRAFRVRASIGLAHFPAGATAGAGEVLRQADVAMYEVKRAGKNAGRVPAQA